MMRATAHRATPLANSALCSLLAIGLVNCSPQANQEQTSSPADTALSACQRPDVQEVVGKETRGKLLKSALPKLIVQEMLGLDTSRAIDDLDKANVTFDHVSLDKPGALGEPPFQQIVCAGHLQIDMSTPTSGQQIIGIDRLRWVINYSVRPADPANDAFTVDVDDLSIQRGITVNGHRPDAEQTPPQTEETPTDVDAEIDAARVAADEAEKAAAEASAEAQAITNPGQRSSQQQSGDSNPPSKEDMYAPH
jgi:hypothetical protein